jgi:hypothetical protein
LFAQNQRNRFLIRGGRQVDKLGLGLGGRTGKTAPASCVDFQLVARVSAAGFALFFLLFSASVQLELGYRRGI